MLAEGAALRMPMLLSRWERLAAASSPTRMCCLLSVYLAGCVRRLGVKDEPLATARRRLGHNSHAT